MHTFGRSRLRAHTQQSYVLSVAHREGAADDKPSHFSPV